MCRFVASVLRTAALNLATISRGVFAGANNAVKVPASIGTPASRMVGTSGNSDEGFADVTARARSLPRDMPDRGRDLVEHDIDWPPRSSTIAALAPL